VLARRIEREARSKGGRTTTFREHLFTQSQTVKNIKKLSRESKATNKVSRKTTDKEEAKGEERKIREAMGA
jgi:hypothetical protein